jgi:hypothetical protein
MCIPGVVGGVLAELLHALVLARVHGGLQDVLQAGIRSKRQRSSELARERGAERGRRCNFGF